MYKVKFITLDETDKDLIISFALADEMSGVKSLTLQRTLFVEGLLSNAERGVVVSMEDVKLKHEHLNMLNEIRIKDDVIEVSAVFSEYQIDISHIERAEIESMILTLEKQNYDERFAIQVT